MLVKELNKCIIQKISFTVRDSILYAICRNLHKIIVHLGSKNSKYNVITFFIYQFSFSLNFWFMHGKNLFIYLFKIFELFYF